MISILRTDRLILKVLDPADAASTLAFAERNRDFLMEWEPKRGAEYFTLDYHRQLLEEEAKRMAEGLGYRFWMFPADEENRIIGSIALSNIVRGAFQSCHLGYRLDGTEQGKGYMTEGVRAVAAFAFEELRLHRIEANIMPRNQASLRVVKRLGFYEEGLAVKYLKINGGWEDHIHMVLRNPAME